MSDLDAMAERLMTQARADQHGRSAELITRDGPLRQTLIALTNHSRLAEHNAPKACSLYVLQGRVMVTTNGTGESIGQGQLELVPSERHGLTAQDDSVVLLTTVTVD